MRLAHKKTALLAAGILFSIMIKAQEILPLYADSIPNSREVPNEENSKIEGPTKMLIIRKVTRPTLSVYLPPKGKANGASIIICPGGGYAVLAAGHEGAEIAKALNQFGVTAFVLKYRLPDDQSMVNKEIGPLQDAQRAIQLVREQAGRWGVDPGRVGIMGFSAGGHLASTAGTHFLTTTIANPAGTSLRPDFMVLLYPVISFSDSIGHIGSRTNLIGAHPSPEKIREYSNELQITAHTPPSFLVHAGNDDGVKVQNSLWFYDALQKAGVSAELHIYPRGGHGFGLNNPTTPDKWIERLQNWMEGMGWLKK